MINKAKITSTANNTQDEKNLNQQQQQKDEADKKAWLNY